MFWVANGHWLFYPTLMPNLPYVITFTFNLPNVITFTFTLPYVITYTWVIYVFLCLYLHVYSCMWSDYLILYPICPPTLPPYVITFLPISYWVHFLQPHTKIFVHRSLWQIIDRVLEDVIFPVLCYLTNSEEDKPSTFWKI